MRLFAALVTTSLAAVLLVAVTARPAAACSCEELDDAALFADAAAVFVGEVVARSDPRAGELERSSMDPVTLTFQVAEVFKGDVHRTQQVDTVLDGASCGLGYLEPGSQPWLVFATAPAADIDPTADLDPIADPEPPATATRAPGRLGIHLCGGTRTLTGGPLAPELAEARPPLNDPTPAPSAARWLTAAALLALTGGLTVVYRRRPR